MAAQIGGLDRHHHEVSRSWTDRVSAARAPVGLQGAVGVHHPYLDLETEVRIDGSRRTHRRAQSTNANVTASVAATRT
jgi:hypothetical protein